MKTPKLVSAVLLAAALVVPALSQAEIVFTDVTGAVVLVNADDTQTPIANNQDFQDNSVLTVATGPNSSTKVITPAGGFSIGPDALVRITSSTVNVAQGVVRVVGDGVNVVSSQGTIVVNGEAVVGVGDSQTVVNVDSGTASVADATGANPVTVAGGNSATVDMGGAPVVSEGTTPNPTVPASPITVTPPSQVSVPDSFVLDSPQETEGSYDPDVEAASPSSAQ